MGSALSPTTANIFMEQFEEEALKTAKLKPKVWLRYVDDTFVVWQHGEDKIPEFIEHLNSLRAGIKFTWEKENNNQLPFLDVLVIRNSNGKISTSVYRKHTCSDIYLYANSCHPNNQKDSVLRTLVLRALTHCSNKRYLKEELQHLEYVAELNGFKERDVYRHLKWAKSKIRGKTKEFGPKNQKAVLPYFPKIGYKVSKVLQKAGLEVAFVPPRKLKSYMPPIKDSVPRSKQPGVYAIPCECGLQYIGETKRSISTRINEHKKHLDKCEWDKSAVAFHHKETRHKINWEETKIVTQSSNKYVLRFKEALAINSCKNINQDRGLEIPKIWLETLSETETIKSWKTVANKQPKQVVTAVAENRCNNNNRNQETMGIRKSERLKAKGK